MLFLRLAAFCLLLSASPCVASDAAMPESAGPDAALAAVLVGVPGPVAISRDEDGVPGWTVRRDGRVVGYIGSTWEIAGAVGYSGRPLDVLVAIGLDARIAGARLVCHAEPVLTLGISEADIAAYVDAFSGVALDAPRIEILKPQDDLPDVISRATVSTGVIRDGILRTARTLAMARGVIAGGGLDRLGYRPASWADLLEMGALSRVRVTMDEAARALAGASVPVPAGPGAFLDLHVGLADPPTAGRNLLGQQVYTRALGSLGSAESALVVVSSGLHSHRGTDWKRTGVFDRIAVVQGAHRVHPTQADFMFVRRLAAEGAPEVKEISVFRLDRAFDPTRPIRIEVVAERPAAAGGTVAFTIAVDYVLPAAFRAPPPPSPEPLWQEIWAAKRPATAFVATMLAALALILFFQESIVRRPRLWRGGRTAFLLVTLVVLGWGVNGQLSVVQVVAFVHSLLSGFRWETFLIEPVIFLLWSFVALGLLFWGRGVYCGWLCPFGALQELLNTGARKLGIVQVAVPQALHERLWVIKYTLFVAILALSFQSMHDALVLAEVEPFKTAISMRMMRAWPFVLVVVAILAAGLFIERFYCRYLCPLGAGLAIPAKLKIFDWLHRRPQCGRECRLCETKCTVGAIDPLGRINPNECVLCLRCQVIFHDPATCIVLKRRARPGAGASVPANQGAAP
ncbi:NosR/NirI family protein [Polymorphum gilvum]|uniref:Nitrous oxide reductase regulatory protein NosR n=1 Tax=Polymorphum gilvum (strain LMG 25793 / CGMCC 1.9160 / SL003B-26A1) TaxID=991905 RepID=F2J4R8_POLGS|nr:NosR/NirI family protein [Polymorphum gilvum]ADZ69010.1 Nitrous oxide reductase regulatory protein NosR [Polymorphum gilvum SL003B-26A1]